jgi:hypothetical protein
MSRKKKPELLTTNQVSEITGQAPRTIQIHALKYDLGILAGGVRLFTQADVEELKTHVRQAAAS